MNPTLAAIDQWIVVLLVPKTTGKIDKIPVHYITGQPCNAHDPSAWTSYAAAHALATAWGAQYTVGLVLTAADDLFCLDIDGALQPDGSWSPLAQQLCAGMTGCMVELSLSGKGLHVWGRYANPPPHSKKNIPLGLELYTELRFIAIGTQQTGEIAPRCEMLPSLIAQVFPPREAAGETPSEGPRADWRGPTDDDDLIRRALASKSLGSVFGTKATFADLWDANAEVLAKAYPSSDQGDAYDASSADAALASHLAFWTGCDVARIERLMRRSALARDKWDNRSDYLVERTIRGAVGMQRDVLKDKPMEPLAGAAAPVPPPPPLEAAPGLPAAPPSGMHTVEGSTFLGPQQQAELFAGCTYVLDLHRVLVPGGMLLKPDQVRARFGGYTFTMDSRNERTTRNAWEALTESQVLRCPRADTVTFKPQLPFGQIVESGGRTLVNTYSRVNVPRKPGPALPFMAHLAKLFPAEYERSLVFYTLCALVQRQGYKAQWALVIQGVEGNGKTLLSRCVAKAIGAKHVHWPRADKIAKDFNAWLVGKTFYAVEEILVGDKHDLLEVLKPLITSEDGIEVEMKGVDQTTVEICGNFLFTTNHKNALKKTRNDRRFCVLYCPQQFEADLKRDGMDGDYMSALYRWLKYEDGYAEVADLLWTTPIPPEFDFSQKLQRAPKTGSTEESIEQGLGMIEQEVLEAVGREEVGFKGGWISSGFFDALLKRIGKDRYVPLNRRREMLQSLGYDWHPALKDGRVHNPVMPDGAKVKLFYDTTRTDLAAMTRPPEIALAYTGAQMVSGVPSAK